jgi:uncharacterized protein involved in exopolysaccharide biosynthesis
MRIGRFTPWLLVATLTVAGAAAAAGYGLTAPKRYRATAQLLVAPMPAGDPTFAGLDVLRDVADKPRAAASASVLVRSSQVADSVRTQLGLRTSVSSLLSDVRAHPAGDSDVVDVVAESAGGAAAAQLANAFVDAFIAQRTTTFQSQLASAIARDVSLQKVAGTGSEQSELGRRLALLRSFQGQPDPTVRRAASATAPASAAWPVVWRLVLIGAGIGLLAGALVSLVVVSARRRGVHGPQYSRGMSDRAVEALVQRLEQRLAARESSLAVRERELQAKIDELRGLEQERSSRAAEPEAELDGDLRRREAELAARERALADRVAAVQERELALARAQAKPAGPAEQPAPVSAPAPPTVVSGAFNVDRIERLLEERGGSYPDRLDEWQSTLFFLREYAEPDGTLPGSFDWLVQDTFGPLLA